MRWLLLCLAAGCGATDQASQEPTEIIVHLAGPPPSGPLAYQDGDAPWQLAPPPDLDGTYHLMIQSSTYSVAWACIGPVVYNGTSYKMVGLSSFGVDEIRELTVEVSCAPLASGSGTVQATTDCNDGVVSEWDEVPGAVGYTWSATNTRLGCGNMYSTCVTTWRAQMSAAGAGEPPRFAQPPLNSLAGWPTTYLGCPDVIVDPWF